MTIRNALLIGGALGVAAALLTVMATKARAFAPADCQVGIGVAVCQPRPAPDARIIQLDVPVRHEEVTDADRANWERECAPKRQWGGTNVVWVYAFKGCEFGPQHLDE